MYALFPTGRINDNIGLCYENSTDYGCTSDEGNANYPYPFLTHTITISLESHLVNGVEQSYLHNVISQEMSEGVPLSSYVAQAIASRTYIYAHIHANHTINNSTAYQVYLPYRYATLGGPTPELRQQKVDDAITLPGALYMTLPTNTDPIFAFFGADNCLNTATGAYPYLKSILDPISPKPADIDGNPSTICDNGSYGTGLGGMSSAGAARWGRGNTSPVGRGDLWSIQWGADPINLNADWHEGLRILSHHYTNIVIRNPAGEIITPAYRWTPLQVDWGDGAISPPLMTISQTTPVTFLIQNSGILTFSQEATTTFTCWWVSQHGTETPCSTTTILPTLNPGDSFSLTIPLQPPPNISPGLYTLIFDAAQPDGRFHQREGGKPWFTLETAVCLNGCSQLYLPLLSKHVFYLSETFDTLHTGWHFYSGDTERVPNYVYLNSTEGHLTSPAIFITEQVGLFSYDSGAIITLTTPVSVTRVTLTYWVKRAGPIYGAYEVYLNGQVAVSERSAASTWIQQRHTLTLNAPTHQLILDFKVPTQLGYRHALLFDEIVLVNAD